MLELKTGGIGSSKTLTSLRDIINDDNYSTRPLFVYGVEGFDVDLYEEKTGSQATILTKDEVLEWHKHVPKNSVVLIDEVQKLWRQRKVGSAVPIGVQELETSRHLAIDFVMTCQFPTQLDNAVRQLVQRHVHLERKFGTNLVTSYLFEEVQYTPLDWHAKQKAIKSTHYIKKLAEYYPLYKSADTHNIKPQIPKKVFFFFALIAISIFLIFKVVGIIVGDDEPNRITESAEQSSTLKKAEEGFDRILGTKGLPDSPPNDEDIYINKYKPRIKNLPHSAEAYDHLTQPVSFPIPNCFVAHYDTGDRCRCVTQQGTKISQSEIDNKTCFHYVKNGYPFDPTREPSKSPKQKTQETFVNDQVDNSSQFNVIENQKATHPTANNSYRGITN